MLKKEAVSHIKDLCRPLNNWEGPHRMKNFRYLLWEREGGRPTRGTVLTWRSRGLGGDDSWLPSYDAGPRLRRLTQPRVSDSAAGTLVDPSYILLALRLFMANILLWNGVEMHIRWLVLRVCGFVVVFKLLNEELTYIIWWFGEGYSKHS